jgi:hypothetical protein
MLEFNLSQFTALPDLIAAFHPPLVRDRGLSGVIPLVFFDEFDRDLDARGRPRGTSRPAWGRAGSAASRTARRSSSLRPCAACAATCSTPKDFPAPGGPNTPMEIGFVFGAARYADGAETLDLAAVRGQQLAEPRHRHLRQRRRRSLAHYAPRHGGRVAQRVVQDRPRRPAGDALRGEG